MALLFSILKIIGIILLIIVIIVAAIVACLLFVPVCYEAKGDIGEGNYRIRVHWFLRAFQFLFYRRDGTNGMELRLFWRRSHLLDAEYREKRKRKREEKKLKKQERKKEKQTHEFHKKRSKLQQKIDLETETRSDGFDKTEDEVSKKIQVSTGKSVDSSEYIQKSSESVQKCAKTPNTTLTGNAVKDDAQSDETCKEEKNTGKIKDIFRKIKKGWTLIQTWHPLSMIWPPLQKLLYRIRPTTLKSDLIFGFVDPSVTGKILGTVSNLYFLYYYEEFHLQGNFETEETYIDGTFLICGKIRGIHLLVFIIRLLSKKDFRKFLGAIKKSKNGGN